MSTEMLYGRSGKGSGSRNSSCHWQTLFAREDVGTSENRLWFGTGKRSLPMAPTLENSKFSGDAFCGVTAVLLQAC